MRPVSAIVEERSSSANLTKLPMIRTGLLILFLCGIWIGPVTGALRRGEVDLTEVPSLRPHYQPEFSFDTNTDAVSWTKQETGLHVAFGSTDELYLRCEVPGLKRETRNWEAGGWRGERLNAQVLVWSTGSHQQIRFQASDLRNDKGQVIPKDRIKFSLVRYVLSNLPYQARGFSCDVTNDAAYLMPDRLEHFERFDLPARTVRPVWFSIDIPANAEPGEYSGTVQVHSASERATLYVKIRVQPRTLPDPKTWKFRLDLWQNPWVVASYFQVEPWSGEHKALLKKHLKLYAEAGGKYITTYTVYSPWSDNSYVLEGTMIGWLKTAGGSWKFDYSIFDQYVELAMEAGVDEAITIYTPVPWGHRFRYLDERSGNFVHEEWSPKSAAFKAFWKVFLDDLKIHLQKKGWFEKTYLGINENPLEFTLAAAKVIKEHSKDWKITYAGDWHAELSSLLNDYSVVITREPGVKELQERIRGGFTTTYYVCCNPPQPNSFVFSAPVESRYIGWYASAYGYNGFLRWAYDAWPADPMRDARHTLWPAGDCFLVYPGGNSSIRFEKLREGIADYEKMRLLRESASRSSNEKSKNLMEKLERLLSGLAAERDHAKRDYDVPRMIEALEQGKMLIDALSLELDQ
jgi:glycosyl hydrolase family 123